MEGFWVTGASGWAQFTVGLAVFLAPGLVAAWRLLPQEPMRWLLAPVVSVSLLVLTAVVLDYVLHIPITAATTALLALAWTLLLARAPIVRRLTGGP